MDTTKIGHIGIELALIAGGSYYLINQNKQLQGQIDDLKKQLSHVAIHTHNSQQEFAQQLKAMSGELDKLRQQKSRGSDRDLLRSATTESPRRSPRRSSRRSRVPETSPILDRAAARAAAREAIRNPPVETRRTPVSVRVTTPEPSASEPELSPEPEVPAEDPDEASDGDDVEAALKHRST
jgi:TolA-binding protein